MANRLYMVLWWVFLASPAFCQWQFAEKLLAKEGEYRDGFGFSVSLDGTTAIVGAPNDDDLIGAAYVFDIVERRQVWKLLALDGTPGDGFGGAVSLRDGLALVGAALDSNPEQFAGSAYLFDLNTGDQLFKLSPDDSAFAMLFGWSVALGDGVALVGAINDRTNDPYKGAVYLFNTRDGRQIAKLFPTDGEFFYSFGWSVAMSGDIAVIGAPGHDGGDEPTGHAYLFDLATGRELRQLIPADGAAFDAFGASVAISGDLVIVGAYGDDDNGSSSGSMYVFDVESGEQLVKLLATDGQADDWFGIKAAISGSTILVGAMHDADNGHQSGSAYLFDARTGQEIAKLLAPDGWYYDFFGQSVALDGSIALIGMRGNPYQGSDPGAAYLFSCTADWDADADINTRDVLAFLGDWAASDPRTDLDGNGIIEANDFLVFLQLWQARC